MRSVTRVSATLSVLLFLTCTVSAQEDNTARKARSSLTLRSSFINSFQRGNVDDFFHFISQDPAREVDAGSSAYFDLSFAFPFPGESESKSMGIGIGVILFNNHALWGTKLGYGGRAELALQPFLMYTSVPMRFALGQVSGAYIGIDPAVLIGWVTGNLTTLDGTHYEITPAGAVGFQVPLGIDFYPSTHFGLELRAGYRFIQAGVGWSNPDSPTGYTAFTIDDELVMADLSGIFMTMGLLFRL
ncbi:MAG: hypothetical protein KAK01_06065 [Candidatus Marinimicrobia bacterium]|nr:hypothetical protein [Candidatus Neomarinimicrobiota bacterium]